MFRRILMAFGFACVLPAAVIGAAADQPGTAKRWGPYEVTFLKAEISGDAVAVEMTIQNAGPDDLEFSYIDTVRVLSDDGDIGAVQFSSRCSAALQPMGKLKCKLDVAFDDLPRRVTVQLVDDAMSAMVAGREKWPVVSFSAGVSGG